MRGSLALLGALVLGVAGCGKPPEGPPTVVEASQVEPMIYWSSGLIRKRVSIEGYVNFDQGAGGQGIAMGPELTSQPNGGGEDLIRFEVKYGTAANELNLPVLKREKIAFAPGAPEFMTFNVADATFQDAAGTAHPLRQRVRVTGRLEYFRVQNVGLISDEDPRSPTGRRFKPMLTDVVLEASAP